MRKFIFGIHLFILFSIPNIFAQEKNIPPLAEDFTDHLGWTFDKVLEKYGSPMNIFVQRGQSPDLDTVVFYYTGHLYLFWFNDRVWQVRVDEHWEGEVDAVRMGMDRSEIERLWGSPLNPEDENPTWTLPQKGFPSRIQLFFNSGKRLIDLYVYRSDW